MRTIRRALKALIRSPLRGGLLVGVLAVSIGLALIMITVNGAFAQRLDDIRASVGTDVTVRPAGTFGGAGFSFRVGGPGGADGGTVTPDDSSGDDSQTQPVITDDDLQQLTSIPHVASITRQITAQYTGDSLKAVVAALAGALATFPLAQTVADNLVSDTSAAGPQITGPGDVVRGGGPGGAFFVGGPAGAAETSGLLGDVDVAVSAEIFAYAVAIAIGLALLATVVPAWYVGRVRPAEVLRHE